MCPERCWSAMASFDAFTALENLKNKKTSRAFFSLPLQFWFYCRRVVRKLQHKWVSVQTSVMSVFTLFDCPLNLLWDWGMGFVLCFCEDGILIYVKSFKLSLLCIYHTIILIKYYLRCSKWRYPFSLDCFSHLWNIWDWPFSYSI